MKTPFYFTSLFTFLLSLAFTSWGHAQTYCNPTYSNGCDSWRITKVAIPSANFNDTDFTGSCTQQRNKTSTVITMNTGSSYTVNITTIGWIACGLAIDFNQNGNFNDAGEVLFLPTYIANGTANYSGSFTIPTSINPGTYRMRIWNREANSGTGTSACGSYAYGTWVDYTVNVTPTLSTSETMLSKTRVYPNPVSDILNIEDTQTIQSIEIYDFNGKLLINDSSINKKSAAVKLSHLTPGAYTAKIKSTEEIKVFKFIKK